MLILLSPAKTLDFETPVKFTESSTTSFKKETAELVRILRKYKPEELSTLMGISHNLATLNFERFLKWSPAPKDAQTRQAILAYRGDVYDGLQADQFSDDDFHFAQEHMRILSGLYGLLKPLDLIQPYRLEMKTLLKTKSGKDLRTFWKAKITKNLQELMNVEQSGIIINLASIEYLKAVDQKKLNAQIITPVFQDLHNGKYKIISYFAKRARGTMSRFIIRNQITDPENIFAFNIDGYNYNKLMSTDNNWVFTR